MRLIQLGLLASATLFAASAQPNPLPALIDFNDDTPGLPPNIGGINQPTSLTYVGANTTITVESVANGIFTQPVLLSADDDGDYVSVNVGFDAVTSGIVRVEATVSFDRYTDGYFLQTVTPWSIVVTRLVMRDNGEIQDNKARTPVGWYEPNQPFRVRMDIDMDARLWSAAVDNELNGFADDEVVPNLEFQGPFTSQIAGAYASLNTFGTPAGQFGATIAYDDISISQGEMIQAAIDIKFCSDPNAFNCKKKGVLPVTIFGTADFDVTEINIDTLQLCLADGVKCTNAPRDASTFDRGTPDDAGVAQCDLDPATGEELDFFIESDGYLDLDAAFEASEVKAILGDFCDDAAKGDVSEALVIIGETYDGTPIYSVPADDNTGIDRLVKVNK